MPRWFTALFWSSIAIAAVVVGLSTWDAFSASPPDPDPVRTRSVKITRDKWGVPHINGHTDADVAYGIAIAQSQDDFRNLEETLAAVRGRAGAILGEDGAKLDFASLAPWLEAGDEIHVHLLARDTVSADRVQKDLERALQEPAVPGFAENIQELLVAA